MPWPEVTLMEWRRWFVHACQQDGANISALCETVGISRPTAYKWLARWKSAGDAGLIDRSRRPQHVVRKTPEVGEEALVALWHAYDGRWGARKLCRVLANRGLTPPPERTAHRILVRHGLVRPADPAPEAVTRFARSRPNELWQLDHKKAIHGSWAVRTVPLTVTDDASRYLLGLRAQPDKGLASTWASLWDIFGIFGLPEAILCDNDAIFHGRCGPSQLEVRLMRLGIRPIHGRIVHPQTQGKVERLHGTIAWEVLADGHFTSGAELQAGFDRFRMRYNYERPHEALGMDVPASHYRPSERPRPPVLPAMEYPAGTILRTANKDGWISWHGAQIVVGTGLCGERVEVRETTEDVEIFYGPWRLLGARPEGRRRTHAKRETDTPNQGPEAPPPAPDSASESVKDVMAEV